tara:strand:- start:631 stop:846 length:216 start_codon:yes stop_codon:yes gene_type:complete
MSTNNIENKRIEGLQFRVEQLELALMNLMFVIANQDKELPSFIENVKKAESMSKKNNDIISMLVNEEGGDA